MCLCVNVYRHASAGLSIHANMEEKMPEGLACCRSAQAARHRMGKLNGTCDMLKKLPFKSTEGFK